VTSTGCCGAGSDLSGSACSVCGSTARQVIVQLHFLHLTTQACGSPENVPLVRNQYRGTNGEYRPLALSTVGLPRMVHRARHYSCGRRSVVADRSASVMIHNTGWNLVREGAIRNP
jgi:hypothetical protein